MINQEYDNDLISRYLSGNATNAEVRQLEEWVMASPENKAQFKAAKKAWMLSGMQAEKQSVDVNSSWQSLAGRIFGTATIRPLKPQRRNNRWLRIAAGFALVLLGGFAWLVLNNNGKKLMVEATDGIQTINLPDGSELTLNQSTTITYKNDRKSGDRLLQLNGDAFFEVAENKEAPFVIETAWLNVTVLGTSFYVDARPNQEEIQVMVQSGIVEVRTNEQIDTLLQGDKVIFNKGSRKMIRAKNDDLNFNSLKTGILIFNDTPLEQVIFALNRQFGANIKLEKTNNSTCAYDGTFEQRTLSSILTVMGVALDLEIIERPDEVILKAPPCNQQ